MAAIDNDDNKATRSQLDRHQIAYKYLSSFPPGYRFEPDDHELILCYLIPKINGVEELPTNLMYEINIYSTNPQDLTECRIPQGDTKWYFFTPRDKKYKNGSRPNRKAGDGYWKATGADKVIKYNGVEIGFRKSLVFYKGNPPKGDKTQWIMHEFRVAGPPQANRKKCVDHTEDTSMRLDDSVLCSIYKNDGSHRNQSHHVKEENDHIPLHDQVRNDDDNQLEFPQTKMSSTNTNIFAPNNINHGPNTVHYYNRPMSIDHDTTNDYGYNLITYPSTSDRYGSRLMVDNEDQPRPIRSVPSYDENSYYITSWSSTLMQPPLQSWESSNVTSSLSVNESYEHESQRDDYSLGLIVNEHCMK